MVTVDLVLGLAMYSAWVVLLLGPALWIAPEAVRRRIPPARRVRLRDRLASPRALGLLLLAVLLGGISHLIWDFFTHSGMWATQRWAVLQVELAGHALYNWLQVGSSLAGLALIGWSLWRWWQLTPPDWPPAAAGNSHLRAVVLAVLLVVPTLVAGAAVGGRHGSRTVDSALGQLDGPVMRDALIGFILRFTTVAAALILAGAVAWHIARLRGGLRPGGSGGAAGPGPGSVARRP